MKSVKAGKWGGAKNREFAPESGNGDTYGMTEESKENTNGKWSLLVGLGAYVNWFVLTHNKCTGCRANERHLAMCVSVS